MIEIKNMSEKEIQEVINACNDELTRRKNTQRDEAAKKALTALEELVRVAPCCYVDMNEDPYMDEELVPLRWLVIQWKAQNFHFDN